MHLALRTYTYLTSTILDCLNMRSYVQFILYSRMKYNKDKKRISDTQIIFSKKFNLKILVEMINSVNPQAKNVDFNRRWNRD